MRGILVIKATPKCAVAVDWRMVTEQEFRLQVAGIAQELTLLQFIPPPNVPTAEFELGVAVRVIRVFSGKLAPQVPVVAEQLIPAGLEVTVPPAPLTPLLIETATFDPAGSVGTPAAELPPELDDDLWQATLPAKTSAPAVKTIIFTFEWKRPMVVLLDPDVGILS